MSEIILLVGHGSREPAGNREIEEFARQWRARQPDWNINVCFIEFAEPLVEEGLARTADRAGRVIVVPLILNAANHVKIEIPRHIEVARARHPRVEFVYAPHLGVCDPILAILKRRLNQAMRALDMPDPRTTGVILLGRGSSNRMANGEMAKMARWLLEESEHEMVDTAFSGITHPRLERVVQRQAWCGMTQIVVLPYYLFTGTLIERIKRQVEYLKTQYPRIRFARGEHFGLEEEIFQLLGSRVREARVGLAAALMPCDDCNIRALVAAHGHRHDDADRRHVHSRGEEAHTI